MPSLARTLWTSLALIATATLGCSSSDSERPSNCRGGKCDDLADAGPPPACPNVAGIAGNKDPIAELLIRAGDTCPTNAAEMVQKLEEIAPCPQGPGLQTSVVSDGARLVGGPESYRTVTTRSCGDEPDHALFMTLLGVSATSTLEGFSFVEMMAFDPETQLYNFYTNTSGNFNFLGTSIDAIEGNIGCGSCHNQGGPIMKELDDPWVHWDSEFSLPGVDEMFLNEPRHGERRSAEALELVIKNGNDALNAARTTHYSSLASSSVTRLLEPLFCSLEINLETAGEAPGQDIDSIPAELIVDDVLAEILSLPDAKLNMSQAAYDNTVERLGQSVPSFGDHDDLAFKFLFPERAHVEHSAVRALLAAGIIDNDFAADVLSLDFTRPLRSQARCDLLRFAPRFLEAQAPTPDAGPVDTSDAGPQPDAGNVQPDAAVATAGNCCSEQDTGGCEIAEVQECVCATDSFCCDSQWDSICVGEVTSLGCGVCEGAEPPPPVDPGPPGLGVDINELNPDAVREAFIAAMSAATTEELGPLGVKLLQSLQDTQDQADHGASVQAFVEACRARPEQELMDDLFKTAESLRDDVRNLSIIENPAQVPTSDVVTSSDFRLSPIDCVGSP